MHYFLLVSVKVNNVATIKADNAETIMYALKGITLNPMVAITPETSITIIFFLSYH